MDSSRPVSCPVCWSSIREVTAGCDRCQTPHHADCLSFMGGCAVFGCGGQNVVPVDPVVVSTSIEIQDREPAGRWIESQPATRLPRGIFRRILDSWTTLARNARVVLCVSLLMALVPVAGGLLSFALALLFAAAPAHAAPPRSPCAPPLPPSASLHPAVSLELRSPANQIADIRLLRRGLSTKLATTLRTAGVRVGRVLPFIGHVITFVDSDVGGHSGAECSARILQRIRGLDFVETAFWSQLATFPEEDPPQPDGSDFAGIVFSRAIVIALTDQAMKQFSADIGHLDRGFGSRFVRQLWRRGVVVLDAPFDTRLDGYLESADFRPQADEVLDSLKDLLPNVRVTYRRTGGTR